MKFQILRQFRLASLGSAGLSRFCCSFLQIAVNLKDAVDRGEPGDLETNKNLINLAKHIAAPIAYIAGYGELRTRLLDLCFELEDPAEFNGVKGIIDGLLNEANSGEVKQIAIAHTEKMTGWKHGKDFQIELLGESPSSAKAKAERKSEELGRKVEIEELGDLVGGCTIIEDFALEKPRGIDKRALDGMTREEILEITGEECKRFHKILSQKFGRNNHERTICVGCAMKKIFCGGKNIHLFRNSFMKALLNRRAIRFGACQEPGTRHA